MSSLEVPASIALVLVMMSLAVSLSADQRPRKGDNLQKPAPARPAGSVTPQRSDDSPIVGAAIRASVPDSGTR